MEATIQPFSASCQYRVRVTPPVRLICEVSEEPDSCTGPTSTRVKGFVADGGHATYPQPCSRGGSHLCYFTTSSSTGALVGEKLTTAGAERRVDPARGIGETWRYTFDAPPTRPFEWIDEETVVFLTASGTATIDVPTGSVTERTDPDITPSQQPERPVQGPKLQPGNRYGPWTVTGDSRFLIADDSHGDVRCVDLLVSPDERYVACGYGVIDRMAESSTAPPP